MPARLAYPMLATLLIVALAATSPHHVRAAKRKPMAIYSQPGWVDLGINKLNKRIVKDFLKRNNRDLEDFQQSFQMSGNPKMVEYARQRNLKIFGDKGGRYKIQWKAFVPESYRGEIPFGIFFDVGPYSADDPEMMEKILQAWRPVFEQRRLIWVITVKGTANAFSNRGLVMVEGIEQLKKNYAIDEDRIYIRGWDTAGRETTDLALRYADIISGAYIGTDPFSRSTAEPPYHPDSFPLWKRAQQNQRFVVVAGRRERGTLRGEMIRRGFAQSGFAHAKFIEIPQKNNGPYFDASAPDPAIAFLDSPLVDKAREALERAKRHEEKGSLVKALLQYRMVIAHGGEADFMAEARKRFEKINGPYSAARDEIDTLIESGQFREAQQKLILFKKEWKEAAAGSHKRFVLKLREYRKQGPRLAAGKSPASDATKTPAPEAAPEPKTFPLRTWTDSTGKFTIEARLIRVVVNENGVGEMVVLERANKKIVELPLAKLSQADAEYVASTK